TNGGPMHVLRTGVGKYEPNPPYPSPKSTHAWYAQPEWIDNSRLLFLSDFEKMDWNPGVDAPLLDLQVFSLPLDNPNQVQDIAYASYGDGGNRDPQYRPGHSNQIVYTHYAY